MNSKILEKKAVDIRARLGTSYDAYTDRIVEQLYARKNQVQIPEKRSMCKVFSGDRSTDRIDYLEKLNFDPTLRQSLLVGTIQPSGVSSLINYKQPINENTRLLYFSYITKIEESSLPTENINQFVVRSQSPIIATHIITKIHWGIELLCVISISDDLSIESVDNLLLDISKRLEDDKEKFILTNDERLQIRQLKNATIYGSKNCITNSYTSMDMILTQLPHWLRFENYHHPLLYTMNSLSWIYKDTEFIYLLDINYKNNRSIAAIRSIIRDFKNKWIMINNHRLLEQHHENVSDFQFQLSNLLKTFQQLVKDYQKIQEKLCLNICQSREIHQILSNQSYLSLISELRKLHENIEQFVSKPMIMQRLQNDQIKYITIDDILTQEDNRKSFEDIDTMIKSILLKDHPNGILLYSCNRLIEKSESKWETIYQQFKLESDKSTMSTVLIYVDFIGYEQILEDFIIVSVPKSTTQTSFGM